jgi:Flp pilus assembly protein TadD
MSDRQDVKDGAALQDRAGKLMDLARYQEALVVLARALPIAPDRPWVLSAMAICHYNLKQYAETLRLADESLGANPRWYVGHFMRAAALLHLGRALEAETAARKALAEQPEERQAWAALIGALVQLRRYNAARKAAENYAAIAPDDAEAHHKLGLVATMQFRWEDAERHYWKALELGPDWSNTVTNLAIVVGRLGRWRESLDLHVQAIQMNPSGADTPLDNLVADVEVSISPPVAYGAWVACGILTSVPFAVSWPPSTRPTPCFIVAAALVAASAILLAGRLAAAPRVVRRYYWQRRRDTWRTSLINLSLVVLSFIVAWTCAGAAGRLAAHDLSVAALACVLAGAAGAAACVRVVWRRWNGRGILTSP